MNFLPLPALGKQVRDVCARIGTATGATVKQQSGGKIVVGRLLAYDDRGCGRRRRGAGRRGSSGVPRQRAWRLCQRPSLARPLSRAIGSSPGRPRALGWKRQAAAPTATPRTWSAPPAPDPYLRIDDQGRARRRNGAESTSDW
jgi:hypothetical protein